MEIIFLWTRNHHPFDEASFSFNGRFNINLTIDEDTKHINIDVYINESFPHKLFGDQITNLSCIIGKNGSGKTRLLELLIDIEKEEDYSIPEYIKITYFEENMEFIISHNLHEYVDAGFHIRPGKPKYKITSNIYPKGKEKTKSVFLKSEFIYYTPFLDLKNFPIRTDSKTYIDVSTDFLIIKDKETNTKNGQSDLETHRFKNIQRQLEFSDKFKNDINLTTILKIPSKIEVYAVESRSDPYPNHNLSYSAKQVREYFLGDIDYKSQGLLYNRINELGGLAHRLLEKGEISEYKDLQLEKLRLFFLVSFIDHYFTQWNSTNHWLELDIGININEFKGLDAWAACELLLHKENWTRDNDKLGLIFINKLNRFISHENVYIDEVYNDRKVLTSNHDLLLELLKVHFDYLNSLPNWDGLNSIPDIIQIDWRNISSGEKAFMDLFSRLNYANTVLRNQDIHKYTKKVPETEWIYLLIDEGEIGFHPDWQKSYVLKLVQIIPLIFPNLKIQLFLTSHSPFIASDVPFQNIIFLDNKEGKVTVNNSVSLDNTFGANIHTLLADGFFLSNGLIGDFAKNKIQEVIDWLNNPDADINKIEEIKNLIGIIGEPIIKNKLIELLNEKLGIDGELDKINAQIEYLNQLKQELLKNKKDA